MKIPTWGYSKNKAEIFDLAEGEKLPAGFHLHPAMVPGSEAEKRHRADHEREGVKMPWDKPVLKLPEKKA